MYGSVIAVKFIVKYFVNAAVLFLLLNQAPKYKKQDRQCAYNVTLRCVRATIAGEEEQ